MRISSQTLIAALALALPGLALAAQPLTVRFDGHDMPMRETAQTLHTAAGTMQIRTWTWQSPRGNARVVIQKTEGGAPPTWAPQQLQAVDAPFVQPQQAMARMNALMNALMNAQMQAAFGPLSTAAVLLPQPPWALASVLPTAVIVVSQPAAAAQHPAARPALPAAARQQV